MAPGVSGGSSSYGAFGWRGRNGYRAQPSGRGGIKLAFQSLLRCTDVFVLMSLWFTAWSLSYPVINGGGDPVNLS